MQPADFQIDLTELARQSMLERHLETDYPLEVQHELEHLEEAAHPRSPHVKEMRNTLWCSIDNDESRDLDQLTYAEKLEGDGFKIYVAIADVDSLVKKGSAIDRHAQQNTTSVYTPTKIFTMLPEKLSTDLTSLNENADRLAVVVDILIGPDGALGNYHLYLAYVRNHAKLAYNSIAAWLDEKGPLPDRVAKYPGLADQLRLQDQIAHLLKQYRHDQRALTLETIEPHVVIENQRVVDLKATVRNRARDLIEDFMIAANTATARFLKNHQRPSLRRIVRTPKRWDRIVEIAQKHGEILPPQPDAKALDLFLIKRLLLDPLHFPDLSLTIIKLLGNGEYVVEYPGEPSIGHFSLAVRDYIHSTAPNRRYPDLITQRMIKAVIEHQAPPYTPKELENLARQCTQKEDDAVKVERKMRKMAAIVLLSSKIDQTFDALVTGASPKGTWVRILHPPVEGKLVQGFEHLDVGHQIRVKLVHVDIEKGFIDFVRA
jgi:VacB/RNase II family 3'-5' exoribonuclease